MGHRVVVSELLTKVTQAKNTEKVGVGRYERSEDRALTATGTARSWCRPPQGTSN